MNAINETTARAAHEMMSFSSYEEGSATAGYNAKVAEAKAILAHVLPLCATEQQRERAEVLFQKYADTLAAAINRDNEIGTRCPSVMICGAGNFPTRKKEKQVAAWDKNRETWAKAEHYLNELKSAHTLAIKSDDPEVLDYLNQKLLALTIEHETQLLANEYWRKHGHSLDGCPYLTPAQINEINEREKYYYGDISNWPPFLPWQLSNGNASIKRCRERIEAIEAAQNDPQDEINGEGYTYKENSEIMRVQFFFDEKPDDETRNLLKRNGFKWSPKNEAWQRQLTDNGKRAARDVMNALK